MMCVVRRSPLRAAAWVVVCTGALAFISVAGAADRHSVVDPAGAPGRAHSRALAADLGVAPSGRGRHVP